LFLSGNADVGAGFHATELLEDTDTVSKVQDEERVALQVTGAETQQPRHF